MLPIIEIIENICVGCAYCKILCPVNCFIVESVSKYTQNVCIKCKKCIRSCPVSAIKPNWEE